MRRTSAAILAILLALGGTAAAFEPGFAPGLTSRESVSSTGSAANASVRAGVLSADGNFVVFQSSATNLVPAVTSGTVTHVYRHDRHSGTTELVTVAKSGLPSAAGGSAPSVSADGNFVVFSSLSTDLVEGDTNSSRDVFRRDMRNGTTELVSATSTNAFANAGGDLSGVSGAREVSDDGNSVVFTSLSTNLVAASNNGRQQIYVKDMTTKAVVRASVGATGNAGNNNSSVPTISGNGRVVAFRSEATNLSPLATTGISQVYVRDFDLATTVLASVTPSGTAASMTSDTPALDYLGHSVAFESLTQLSARDTDASWDVFVRDLTPGGTTVLASPSPNTMLRGPDSRAPSISGNALADDGRFVGFESVDDMLVTGDSNRVKDVFLYDRTTGVITLVSTNDAREPANAASSGASVSNDGHLVLFQSTATNLVATSSTGTQLYVRDLRANKPPVVSELRDVSLDEGVALRLAGSFTDNDASKSWTATVDWGDGAGPQRLELNADKSFSLNHLWAAGGPYTVTVAVTDDAGATGTSSFHVTVKNIAPTVSLGSAVELAFDPTLHQTGTFDDPGTTETYTATVDYNDGSGPQALALTGRSFLLDHVYALPGTYSVIVRVSDGIDTGAATLAVLVRRYTTAWLEPLPFDEDTRAGRTIPLRFAVNSPDGTFVLDRSVQVSLLDASGTVVAGTYSYGKNPAKDVTENGKDYHVNVETRGLEAGDYTVRVSFSSPSLTGEFSAPLTLR